MSESGPVTDGSLLDPISFKDFYDRALPVIYGYFFKRVGGSHALAADLTQETFISAVRTLQRGARVDSPMPWIVTIARRRLVDHIRSGSGTGRTVVRDAPPEDLSTSAAEARLTAALGMLSADHGLALILRYVDDLAVAEVANHLGRSLRATESILARARAALSAAYDEVADV